MPILDLNQMKVESKMHELFRKGKEKAKAGVTWCMEHPESTGIVLGLTTTVIGGAVKIGKTLIRNANLKQEQYNKERYIYDRSLGMYLHTKRPLRNKDYVSINARRKKGEKLSDILSSMKILD